MTPTMSPMSTPSVTTPVNGHTPLMSAAPALPAASAPQAPAAVKRRGRKRLIQNLLTLLVYVLATVASADGMWSFFRDVLLITFPPLLVSVFSIFEASVFVSALRARQARLDDVESKGGIDALAVWILAALSGVFSASHETVLAAQAVRLVLPLLAAYMFERAMSAEQGDVRQDSGKRRKRITFRFSPERILVALGIADPSDRDAAAVNRDRTIARLATLSVRANRAPAKRRQAAQLAFQLALEKANERLGISTDPRLMDQLQRSIALLYGAVEATAPEAVAAANPWKRVNVRSSTTSQTGANPTSGARAGSRAAAVNATDQPRQRVPAEELLRQLDEQIAAQPGLAKKDRAALLGVSPERLRQVWGDAGRPSNTDWG